MKCGPGSIARLVAAFAFAAAMHGHAQNGGPDTTRLFWMGPQLENTFLLPRPSFEWHASPFAKIQGGVLSSSLNTQTPVGLDIRGPLLIDELQYSTGVYGFREPGIGKGGYLVRSHVASSPFEIRNRETLWQVGLNVNHVYGADWRRKRADELTIVGTDVVMEWRNWELRKLAGINVAGRRQALVFDTSLDYALARRSHLFVRWSNFTPGLWQLQAPTLNLGIRLGKKP